MGTQSFFIFYMGRVESLDKCDRLYSRKSTLRVLKGHKGRRCLVEVVAKMMEGSSYILLLFPVMNAGVGRAAPLRHGAR